MGRALRECGPAAGLVLDVGARTGPPPLRFEVTDGGRMLLRQGERPVLVGRTVGDGCCRDLHLRRTDDYRSPLPPPRAATMRSATDWPHRYARELEETEHGPLHEGRWQLTARTAFAPGIWTEDLVRDWPTARLELLCGGGWHGVLPLRCMSPPDAPRVKAYRKHVREGTIAPVLLWWVSFLDGWLLLDGHDRAMAALAEGGTPPCVVLARLPDEADWRRQAAQLTAAHEEHTARLAARPPRAGIEHQRATLERGFADVVAGLPYEEADTSTWPLPGGPEAWQALAARAMLQCPGD
ncbi:hypothetical protein ABZ484_24905 [Streptomyces sp. NPDC006393]|uniref:hypothetical protein n=1 Tax=Streptomyces sp. NPDC006393 TaxID=3156763 RepID=UPI0033F8CBE1